MSLQGVSQRKMQRGLTLVELMIALAIGLFMSAVIASLYLNMRGGFRYQEDLARIQESGRFAMDVMARDVRMAGYNGCGSLTNFANVVTGGGSSVYLNFLQPVIGYEGGTSSFPAEITAAGAIAGVDAIILLGVDPSSELIVQSHNPPSAQINTNTHSIKAGEILLITDCGHSTLFQMTGPSSANPTNIVHNTGTGSPGNCTKYLGASCGSAEKSYQYKPGSSLMRVYANAYFIAPASSGHGRSLWSMSMLGETDGVPNAKELVEGIENMQISYGVDTDGDKSANQFLTASSVTDWSKVVLVRVSLLASSTKDNLTATSSQTYDVGGTTIAPTDRKLRKVFTDSITIRNRTP